MSSKFSLARAVAVALVAIGSVASLGTDAFAANRTWTPVGSGTTQGKWGTALVYASNWSGGTATGNPTPNDTGVFNSAAGQTVSMVANNSTPIGILQLSGATTGARTFSGPTSTIVISGTGAVPNVGISSTATRDQIFSTTVKVDAPRMTFQNTGAGILDFRTTLDLNGNYLKGVGSIKTSNLASTVAGATYEAVSGTQALSFDPTNGPNIGTLLVSGATVSGDGTSSTNLTITSGSYVGNGTFQNALNTSGVIDLGGNTVLSTANFVQSTGGNIAMDVVGDGTTTTTSSTVFGNFELGGAMDLNASGLGTTLYPIGASWGLFAGTNYTGGSPSGLNDASNFSLFAMTPASSGSPYYGTFTKYGQEWTSPKASDGTYLVFQAASGNLVVVPEPSTMVFAGLGMAMSGWTMWKKRRLGKLLAAKAG